MGDALRATVATHRRPRAGGLDRRPDGCGHFLPEECPDELTEAVLKFWQSTKGDAMSMLASGQLAASRGGPPRDNSPPLPSPTAPSAATAAGSGKTPSNAFSRKDGSPTQAGDDVEAFSAPRKNRVGHISVRHMCDDGVLSRPSPSFGCLKLRPMMSTKSSRSTLASGSNE